MNVTNKVKSVRAEALGGAGAAVSDDLSMLWVTPVAVAPGSRHAFCVGAERGPFGETTGQVLVGVPSGELYMFGGGGLYGTGGITLNASDGSSREVTGQSDYMGLFGISRELSREQRQGFQVKIFRSELLDEFTTASVVVDLGAQMDLSEFVTAGAAITNFGTTLKYKADAVNQPSVARAGLAFRLPLGFDQYGALSPDAVNSMLACVDVEYSPTRYNFALCGGAELNAGGMLIIRGGGRLSSVRRIGNLTAGLGINIKEESPEASRLYRLDYAFRLVSDGLKVPHLVSLTCVF